MYCAECNKRIKKENAYPDQWGNEEMVCEKCWIDNEHAEGRICFPNDYVAIKIEFDPSKLNP